MPANYNQLLNCPITPLQRSAAELFTLSQNNGLPLQPVVLAQVGRTRWELSEQALSNMKQVKERLIQPCPLALALQVPLVCGQ